MVLTIHIFYLVYVAALPYLAIHIIVKYMEYKQRGGRNRWWVQMIGIIIPTGMFYRREVRYLLIANNKIKYREIKLGLTNFCACIYYFYGMKVRHNVIFPAIACLEFVIFHLFLHIALIKCHEVAKYLFKKAFQTPT